MQAIRSEIGKSDRGSRERVGFKFVSPITEVDAEIALGSLVNALRRWHAAG